MPGNPPVAAGLVRFYPADMAAPPSTADLFGPSPAREAIGPQAFVLRGFALPVMDALLPALDTVVRAAPLRRMSTPGGRQMSVAMTSCGALGWVSDRTGYRYSPTDPGRGEPWPPMPPVFRRLAVEAAAAAGFPGFDPDACLVNRYRPGTRMGMHQDRDEPDLRAPIVSVSLGLPATFRFGGLSRGGPTAGHRLEHGDVVVWGGVDRLRFHGVSPVRPGHHPLLGEARINLTFRRAAPAPDG